MHMFYVGIYFPNLLFVGRNFWIWNCEFHVTLFHMWKPTMEQDGFNQWNHGTGRRAHLMYTRMANGQKKSDIKLFSSSSDTCCRLLHTYHCAANHGVIFNSTTLTVYLPWCFTYSIILFHLLFIFYCEL